MRQECNGCDRHLVSGCDRDHICTARTVGSPQYIVEMTRCPLERWVTLAVVAKPRLGFYGECPLCGKMSRYELVAGKRGLKLSCEWCAGGRPPLVKWDAVLKLFAVDGGARGGIRPEFEHRRDHEDYEGGDRE